MAIVQKIPRDLEVALGPKGTDGLIDLLNTSFGSQKEDVIQVVADKFEKRLTEEISKMRIETKSEIYLARQEISGIREDITELQSNITIMKSEFNLEMTDLKSELNLKITDLKSELKSEMTGLKSELNLKITDL